ncbi:MAG: hypothetical protein ABI652_04220 [Acidobacteriota bacterium]
MTMMAALLLAALGGSLVMLSNTEAAASSNFQAGAQVLYAAEATLERAVAEIGAVGDWTEVLAGSVHASMLEAGGRPVTSWNETLDLVAVTAGIQAQSAALGGLGANTPRWRLFASGPFSVMVASATEAQGAAYVAAWVADDAADRDDQPESDSNGVIQVRAWAIDVAGLRRCVQAVIRRHDAIVSVLSWREII